jgi:ABC-type uncharacterized transport system substrate-binding protein
MASITSLTARLAATCAAIAITAAPAAAHPHVWVDVKSTVVYEDGRITGFKYSWTFDEGYSTMAVDGLKEFDYFTHAKLDETALKIDTPKDYWLEHKDGILTLHFTLPLQTTVLGNAQGFTFQVFDPSYYIAFDLAKEKPVTLAAGAPAGCKADVSVPPDETAEAEKLGEAFFQQFGGDIGIGLAKTISVTCPAS